jgi:hypothetical protein
VTWPRRRIDQVDGPHFQLSELAEVVNPRAREFRCSWISGVDDLEVIALRREVFDLIIEAGQVGR